MAVGDTLRLIASWLLGIVAVAIAAQASRHSIGQRATRAAKQGLAQPMAQAPHRAPAYTGDPAWSGFTPTHGQAPFGPAATPWSSSAQTACGQVSGSWAAAYAATDNSGGCLGVGGSSAAFNEAGDGSGRGGNTASPARGRRRAASGGARGCGGNAHRVFILFGALHCRVAIRQGRLVGELRSQLL